MEVARVEVVPTVAVLVTELSEVGNEGLNEPGDDEWNEGLLERVVVLGSSVTGHTVVVTMISVVTTVLWAGQLVTTLAHDVMVRVVVVVMVLVVHLVVEAEVEVVVSGSSVSHSSSLVVEVDLVEVVLVEGGAVVVVSGALVVVDTTDELDAEVEVEGAAVDEAL